MNTVIGVVIGLLILIFLVVIHELGHAIMAKKAGVKVEEFGVGFPPKAKKIGNWGDTELTLNWLPLGGFVRLKGEYDSSNKKGDYGKASYWQKTKILAAGVMVNWFFAAFLFMILALFGTLPKVFDNQFVINADYSISKSPVTVTYVAKDSPADKAGIKLGDEILAIKNEDLTSDNLAKITEKNAGKTISVEIKNKSGKSEKSVRLNDKKVEKQGYFGVQYMTNSYIRSTWSSPLVGLGTAVQYTGETLGGLGKLVADLATGITKKASLDSNTRTSGEKDLSNVSKSVAGPIGILGVIFPAATEAGISTVIYLAALISLTLAIMNFLPIPAMDGGRWFLMTIFKLSRKKLTKEIEEKVQFAGVMIIILLTVLVLWADVSKLF